MTRTHQDIIGDQNRELEQLRREIKGHLKAWDIEHAEVGRLRAAAELAHKRLLDVVRNGDAEPEDMEAYEALDRALKDKP